MGQKFIKFVHDIAGLLTFNLLKADFRSANPLSNAEAKSKGRSWRCLRTSPKFNSTRNSRTQMSNTQRPLGDRQTDIGIIIPTNMPTKPVK